jgi:hypothetical protein
MAALVVALQGEPITGERDPPDRAQQRLGQPPEVTVRTAAISAGSKLVGVRNSLIG